MVEFLQIGIKMSTNKFTVEYRKTMSNFATGVTVVTTFDEKKINYSNQKLYKDYQKFIENRRDELLKTIRSLSNLLFSCNN